MTTPYHAGLRDDHVYWYIKLIPRHLTDELHVESQTGGTDMWGEVLDDSVKVSSSPAQPVAFTVPDDTRNENHVNRVKAHGMNILGFRLKNAERAGSQFASQVFDLAEEQFDVSLLHDWNEDAFFLVKSRSDQGSSVDLAVFANVARYSSGSHIFVEMQYLIDNVLALLLDLSN